jgi:predicted nicotinamide N-methyase
MTRIPDRAAFIRARTAIATAPLVPEIRLHLATEVTPLWQATEAELDASGLPPPYWAFAWPGGQALSRHVLDNPHLVRGKRVLDFAAGSGIAALAARRAGAAHVTASDLDAFALAAMRLNAALDHISNNDLNFVLTDADVSGATPGAWDVILAGDVCYERPMAEKILPWLEQQVRGGALVLMADPGRAYLPKQGLIELARYTVPTSRDLEDRDTRETRVLQLSVVQATLVLDSSSEITR